MRKKCYPVIFQDSFISYEIRIPSETNQDFMAHVTVLVPAHMRDEQNFENKSNVMVTYGNITYPFFPRLDMLLP